MTDSNIVYDTDIDPRVEDGYVLSDNDLLIAEEWLVEFEANICCAQSSDSCGCGGSTDQLPSTASYLLRQHWEEKMDWDFFAETLSEYRRGVE